MALHTRCHKGLIAYHATSGITIVKKHLEVEHKTFFAKYLEHVANHLKSPLDQELINKRSHITLVVIFRFVDVPNQFAKDHGTQGFPKRCDVYYQWFSNNDGGIHLVPKVDI